MLCLIGEYTRECLSIDVARRLNHDDVLERLAWLMATTWGPGAYPLGQRQRVHGKSIVQMAKEG